MSPDEGFVDTGGALPEGNDTPIAVDPPPEVTPAVSTVDPKGNVNSLGNKEGMADDLAEMEREINGGKGDKPEPTGEEVISPEEPLFDIIKFAEDNGIKLDKDYDSVEDLLLDLSNKSSNLESEVSKNNPIVDKLTKAAEKLGMSPEDAAGILEGIDPRGNASEAPGFAALEKAMDGFKFEGTDRKFYSTIANAIMTDVMQGVKGQMGRMLNTTDAKIEGMSLDMQMNKFLKNDKNAHWRGREKAIRAEIGKYPQWKGKSNAIDMATRLLSKSPDKQIAKTAKEIAAEKVKVIQGKKVKYYSEKSGRTPQPGATPKDPSKMNLKQLEAEGKRLEAAGANLG